MTDHDRTEHHAEDVGELRWLVGLLARSSGAGQVRLRGGVSPTSTGPTYRVLPRAARPRVVFSDGLPPHVVGGVIGANDVRARLRRTASRLAATRVGQIGIGATVHLTGRPSLIDDELARVVEEPEVGIVVRPGNPGRANRKPIVKVVRPDGGQLAYTKIAWNDLTRRLVDREAAALRQGDDPDGQVRTPRLLQIADWKGLRLLTTSPLGTRDLAARLSPVRHAAVALEVARRGDGVHECRLTDAPWVAAVRERIERVPTARRPVLRQLLEDFLADEGHRLVPVGTWHGDWTPWNMQVGVDEVVVWDWERSAPGVPVGMDVVHYHFQVAMLREGLDVPGARRRAGARAREVLAFVPAAPESVVEHAYLLELALRWSEDADEPTGRWLRPPLRSLLASLRADHATSRGPAAVQVLDVLEERPEPTRP